MPCGGYLLNLKSNNPTVQSPDGAFGENAAIKINIDRPGGATLCNSDFQEHNIIINAQDITETEGVAVTQAGYSVPATAGTFIGTAFTAYDFETNADEKLIVMIDGQDPVEIILDANFADVASAASGITIAGATIVVDGDYLKITSKTTGSDSSVYLGNIKEFMSDPNALALFGVVENLSYLSFDGQGIKGVAGFSGTLKTTLTGAGMTSIAITASRMRRFVTTTDIVIGADEWTFAITSEAITQSVGVTVTQGSNSGTLKTALTGATTSIVIEAVAGLTFDTGTEWTLAITAQDITQSVGVTVTQGSVTGTLKTALAGAGTDSVVVSTAAGTTFVSGVAVVIGTGGTATTVVLGNVNTATETVYDVFIGSGGSQTTVVSANVNTATKTKSAATVSAANFQDIRVDDNLDRNSKALFDYGCMIDLKCADQGIQIANGEYKNNVAQENGGALSTDVGRKNSMFEVKKSTFKSNKGMYMKNFCFYISFCKLTSFLSLSHTH